MKAYTPNLIIFMFTQQLSLNKNKFFNVRKYGYNKYGYKKHERHFSVIA